MAFLVLFCFDLFCFVFVCFVCLFVCLVCSLFCFVLFQMYICAHKKEEEKL